jgi:hypothetical protein
MPFARKPVAELTRSAIESRIRRAAERRGLRAIKSRWRHGTPHNRGGWMILGGNSTNVYAGKFYSLDDEAALAFLKFIP